MISYPMFLIIDHLRQCQINLQFFNRSHLKIIFFLNELKGKIRGGYEDVQRIVKRKRNETKKKGKRRKTPRDGRAAYQRATKDKQAVQAASVHF